MMMNLSLSCICPFLDPGVEVYLASSKAITEKMWNEIQDTYQEKKGQILETGAYTSFSSWALPT